jgi:hypothetical protein
VGEEGRKWSHDGVVVVAMAVAVMPAAVARQWR